MDTSADPRRTGVWTAIDGIATSFVPLHLPEVPVGDPLSWPGYVELLREARSRTGVDESVICGRARIGDTDAVLIAFDFTFLGGSVGQTSGDRIAEAFVVGRTERRPIVSLIASGGSRMQEGMRSLHQLQRVAAEIARARCDGTPHLSVLRDPTTGGIWASLGAGADVVLAVVDAQIGFAGRRVRPTRDPDDEEYSAQGQFAAGNVDEVLPAGEVAEAVRGWLRLLPPRPPAPRSPAPPPGLISRPAGLDEHSQADDGWSAVRGARSAARPRAPSYLAVYFDSYRLINGDRCGGRGGGILCGVGQREGAPVAFAAQDGSPTTPAGYRTAARLLRLAERLGLPVLTLVDTPGAAREPEAEADGLAAAIAELFVAMSSASVPVTSLVIGEGGSGGALALAAPDNTWITPDAYFAVIAPELAGAILKRGVEETRAIADHLQLRPRDLVRLGLARGVVTHLM